MPNEDTGARRDHEQHEGSDQTYREREYLHSQYVEHRKSAKEIADDCGVSSSTIHRWLDRHDIERTPRYKDESWLRTQYVERRKDQQTIADECDVAETTICHWLARLGITDGESFKTGECTTCGDTFRYYPSVRNGQYCSNECAKDPQKRQVKVTCPNCERAFQRRQSLDTEFCSMACWGADNRTDTTHYYSTGWHEQREKALERDEHQCVVCGISNEAHQRRFGRGIDVHHIVPVRLFKQWEKPPRDAHTLRNLVSVCRTHHPDAPGTTVESEREWEGDFRSIAFDLVRE